MKINTKELAEKLNKLKDVASKNRIDSAFSGILLENGTALATNSMFSMRLALAEAQDESIVIPISAVDLILNLPDGETELTVSDETMTIRSGKIQAQFATRASGDYPKYSEIADAEPTELSWEDFSEKVSKVLFACAKKNTTPAFMGVHIFTAQDALNIVTCDSYRLAWEKIDRPGQSEIDCIIHREILAKLISVYEGDTVQIKLGRSNVMFCGDGIEFNARLTDGTYPDVAKIIPTYRNICSIDVNDVLLMLRRISPLCDNVTLDIKGSVVKISGRFSSSTGDIADELELSKELPTPTRIAFSTGFLNDAFKAFRGQECVELGFSDEESASIKPMIMTADTLLCLCLPVRVAS